MSVLLTGRTGKIMLAAPGRPMLLGALPVGPIATPLPTATSLSGTAGLAGWWDAAAPAGLLDQDGASIVVNGTAVGAIADRSAAGHALSVFHAAQASPPPLATGRLNGLLGGVGLSTVTPPNLPGPGQQLPIMHPDQGWIGPALPLGGGAAWTLLLVWSRPNWRQSGFGPTTLLSIGGTPVLVADEAGGSNRLVLFPGARQTVLTGALTRRHSHAVVLRNTPGFGVDAWLGSTHVAAGAPNPLPFTLAASPLFLHSGAPGGGAECWLHEAAAWTAALTGDDLAIVLGYQRRWTLGPRKGVQVLVTGQSNAGNGLNDGAWHLLAHGIAWHLGALAYGVVGAYGSPPAATCIHGEGLYPVASLGFSGSFLDNPADDSDPAHWPLGTDGLAVQTWLTANTAPAEAADIAAILWPWSEDDSTREYGEKATYEAAARRFLALQRGTLGRSAAKLPLLWWSAIPFAYGGNDAGMQMQREAVAALAADPAQNVAVALPQTADSLPRAIGGPPLVYDPRAGVWSGGDPLHRDAADLRRFGMLAAPLAARAVLAATGGDTVIDLPASVPAQGGPVVSHVFRASDTSLVVTVRHDCGTDLIVPPTQAVSGAGWAVMDGGSPAAPSRIVPANACTRLNETQVRITLAQPLASPSAACRLFYPYGAMTIGRGNAVTDNLAAVTPPVGWDIAADLGAAWRLNMPLHIPMAVASGIVLSDTP
jgi:hypothetical protein